MDQLDIAKQLLADIGMPKQQQSDLCALAILALGGIGSQGTFVVKRANIDGSGVKTLTPQLTGVFQDMNSHSVTYTDSNGIKQIIRY